MYNSVSFSIFMKLWIHYHNLILEYFHHTKRNLVPVSGNPNSSLFPAPGDYKFTFCTNLHILDSSYTVNEITQYVVFCGWLLSLIMLFLRFISVVAYISTSFLFIPSPSVVIKKTLWEHSHSLLFTIYLVWLLLHKLNSYHRELRACKAKNTI